MNATRLLVVTTLCCLIATTTGSAAKPNTIAAVALEVLFDDSSGMRITSDGLGSYVDGVDGVTANFDQYGNLIINFQTTRTPLRKVHYDFSEPLFGASQGSLVAPPNNYLSTVRRPGDGPLQALAPNVSQCVQGYLTYTNEARSVQYRLSLQRPTGSVNVSESSYLRVTRTPGGTWEVTSDGRVVDGDCVPGESVGVLIDTPLTGKWNFTSHGYYSLPLKLTLTEK